MKRKTNRISVIVFMMVLMAFALLPMASYADSLGGAPFDIGDLDPNSSQVKPAITLSPVKLTAVPDDRTVNGECTVYVYAVNGCAKAIKVKVK